ncbi:MAG: metal-dependent hydrolase, partial [Bryobacteraceae bacterium]
MDNLTHTLTALALSRAGLDRLTPHAAWILVVAANAPDIDVAAGLAGSIEYLRYHRGYTHALAVAPLLAVAPVALVRAVARRPIPWLRATLVSLAGILSHLLLDWTNTYGIRLLLPFSGDWLRLDLLNVIDVWTWAALALAVIGPAMSRLVGSEIGEARGTTGRGAARAALAFLFLWTGARAVLHERAAAVLDARLYQGAPPRRVFAFPTPLDPLRWTGVVEGDGFAAVYN